MRTLFLILLIALNTTAAYSQMRYGIVKFHAFKQDSHTGAVPVDQNGDQNSNHTNTRYLLFVETAGKTLPKFDTVYIGSKAYAPKAEEIKPGKKGFGKLTKTGKPASFSAAKGNRLWQLILWEADGAVPSKLRSVASKNELVFTGRFNALKFTMAIPEAQQLESIFNE